MNAYENKLTSDVVQNKVITNPVNYYKNIGAMSNLHNLEKEEHQPCDFNTSNYFKENYHNKLDCGYLGAIFVNKISQIKKTDFSSPLNDQKNEEHVIPLDKNITNFFEDENLILIKQDYKQNDICNKQENKERNENEETNICLLCLNSTAIGYVVLFCAQKNEKIFPLCLNCISNHAKNCLEDCHKRLICFDDKNNTKQSAIVKYNDYMFCRKEFSDYVAKTLKEEIVTTVNDIVTKSIRKLSKKIHKKTLTQNKNETFLQFISKNKSLLHFQVENISKNNPIIECEPLNLRKMNYIKQRLSDFFKITIKKVKNIFHKIYDNCVCNYKEEERKKGIIITKYKIDDVVVDKDCYLNDKNDDSCLLLNTNKNKSSHSQVDIMKRKTDEIIEHDKKIIDNLKKRKTPWRNNYECKNGKEKNAAIATIIAPKNDQKIKKRGKPLLKNLKSKSFIIKNKISRRKRRLRKNDKNNHKIISKNVLNLTNKNKKALEIINESSCSIARNHKRNFSHEKQPEKMKIVSLENDHFNEFSINFMNKI